MRKGVVVLLVITIAAGCGPSRRPIPTTSQGMACVEYCLDAKSSCRNGCLWWLLLFWPVTLACQGDCDKNYDRCEQACPDMVYPQVSSGTNFPTH
jgi:hypothetical protein